MIAQNLIQNKVDLESLYNLSIRINPSNRLQVSIKPSYPQRGAKSGDIKVFHQLDPNIEAQELWQDGYKADALAVCGKLAPHPIKRSAGGAGSAPWHLYQTASSLKCLLIFYMWGVLGVPNLPLRKQFTRAGRLRLLDAAGVLEKSGYSYSDFYFFTGTLPGSSDLACQFFARNSRPFLNALKDFLRKRYHIYLTFNTWEWQMREKFHLTPALHLHLVIVTKNKCLGRRLPRILKDKWFQLLDYYSDKYAVNLYEKDSRLWTESENNAGYGFWTKQQLNKLATRKHNPCQTCKTIRCTKSPAAYLSKYIGKGSLSGDNSFQDRFVKGNLPLYYPSSWWSVSDKLRKMIDESIVVVGFRNTLDECFRAYHLFNEIMEDKEYGLTELALPPFIPKWSLETRLYQNFYCKNDAFDACKEMLNMFNAGCQADSTKVLRGEASVLFFNAFYPPAHFSGIDNLKAYFQDCKNYKKMDELIYSVPFYHRINKGLDVDWDNPLVISNARKIMREPIEYLEQTYETMEAKYAAGRRQREHDRRFDTDWDRYRDLHYVEYFLLSSPDIQDSIKEGFLAGDYEFLDDYFEGLYPPTMHPYVRGRGIPTNIV